MKSFNSVRFSMQPKTRRTENFRRSLPNFGHFSKFTLWWHLIRMRGHQNPDVPYKGGHGVQRRKNHKYYFRPALRVSCPLCTSSRFWKFHSNFEHFLAPENVYGPLRQQVWIVNDKECLLHIRNRRRMHHFIHFFFIWIFTIYLKSIRRAIAFV